MSDYLCECGKRKPPKAVVCNECRWGYEPEIHWQLRMEKERAAREVNHQGRERVRVRRLAL